MKSNKSMLQELSAMKSIIPQIIIGSHSINSYSGSSNQVPLLTGSDVDYLKRIEQIRAILPWIIVSLGLVGNACILWVFARRRGGALTSNGFCFSALAAADTLSLLVMLARSRLQLTGDSSLTCKLIQYLYYVTLEISSWSLILLTLDRLIAVVFLFKYKHWCHKWFTLKLFVGIVVTFVLVNLHLLIFVQSEKAAEIEVEHISRNFYYGNTTSTTTTTTTTTTTRRRITYRKPLFICDVDSNRHPFYYQHFYSRWDVYHAVIYGAVPFVIILASNILIITKLTILKSKRFTRESFVSSGSTEKRSSKSVEFKSIQITLMLLSVAFLFLLFTGPISIYMVFLYEKLTHLSDAAREYIRIVLRYVGYFNNAINFYTYLVFSSDFRNEFIKCVKSLFRLKDWLPTTSNLCTSSTKSTSVDSTHRPVKKLPTKRMIYNDRHNGGHNDEDKSLTSSVPVKSAAPDFISPSEILGSQEIYISPVATHV